MREGGRGRASWLSRHEPREINGIQDSGTGGKCPRQLTGTGKAKGVDYSYKIDYFKTTLYWKSHGLSKPISFLRLGVNPNIFVWPPKHPSQMVSISLCSDHTAVSCAVFLPDHCSHQNPVLIYYFKSAFSNSLSLEILLLSRSSHHLVFCATILAVSTDFLESFKSEFFTKKGNRNKQVREEWRSRQDHFRRTMPILKPVLTWVIQKLWTRCLRRYSEFMID